MDLGKSSGEFPNVEVLIIGLGPVGAVAANLAGAAGFRTLVVERGDEPYSMPRAIVFDAEVMRIFASIGLADEISAVTKPLGGSVYLGVDRKPIRKFQAHPRAHDLAWHPSNLFYQPQLEALLRAGLKRFPNVSVLTGHEVTALERNVDDTLVRIVDASGVTKEISAPCILGCDGARSVVRKALDIRLDDIGFEERWLVVDTFVNGPMRWPDGYAIPPAVRDDHFSLMVCDPERPCTLIPGSGRHRRWEYMLLAGERDEEVVTDSWVQGQIARWVDPGDVEIVRAAVYRFRALVAERWREDGIFLVGDAAHQTPPFFGQGMCHGIRDAAQLLWKVQLVRQGKADAKMLDSYQAEREPHVREIISASVAAGAQVCKLDLDAALARDAAFRAAEKARDRRVAMTDIVPPIRAGIVDPATGGMRLPEFVVTVGGEPRHIDTLLDGRFSLLSLGPVIHAECPEWSAIGGQDLVVDATGTEGSELKDADGRLDTWFAQRQIRWAIVRPDRYVYATAATQAELDAALDRLFIQLHLNRSSSESRGRIAASEAILP